MNGTKDTHTVSSIATIKSTRDAHKVSICLESAWRVLCYQLSYCPDKTLYSSKRTVINKQAVYSRVQRDVTEVLTEGAFWFLWMNNPVF